MFVQHLGGKCNFLRSSFVNKQQILPVKICENLSENALQKKNIKQKKLQKLSYYYAIIS